MLTVSVIIPTYNCAQYVTEAIDSVLNQTYKDFEIIVIDDGSTDNTAQILKPYIQSEKIRYFYQKNSGQEVARNKGILEAKGEYIAFLDADDILLENSISKRAKFLEKHADIALVFTDYYINKQKEMPRETLPELRKMAFLKACNSLICFRSKDSVVFKREFYSHYLSFTPHPIWTGTVMLRRGIIKDVGLFPNIVSHADRVYFMRIIRKYIAGFLDESLSVYNCYRSYLSKNRERYHLSRIDTLMPLLKDKMVSKKLITKLIGADYFFLGYYYYQNNFFWRAKKNFLISIQYRPFGIKQWIYLFSPPRNWLAPLIAIRKRVRK